LLHSCVKVREPIELSFGVVSGVGIGVLDWGRHAARGRAVSWGFSPIGFNGFQWRIC